ncbi:Protein of unknown function [Pyronema omphalodes CBS 100304]|uniref:Uncharacterized protein n=1 Tax=Pyronema omphalodes (strain CBS 100304) TaxID=1076935 RepID=U4L4B5_PYROM|nr:Protein of unknown function [Pyronema omphalodes CBS 100304]
MNSTTYFHVLTKNISRLTKFRKFRKSVARIKQQLQNIAVFQRRSNCVTIPNVEGGAKCYLILMQQFCLTQTTSI